MKNTLRPLLALAFLLTTTGCIEFAEQTMTYRYDAKADTLYLFQDYHGIFGADNPASLSKEESDQFNSVLKTQRTFFFNNWITEYNRETVVETMEKLRDPAQRAEMKLPEGAQSKLESFLKLLLENVHIENGPFYFDSHKRLCGVQMVTITKCSAVVVAGNDYAPHFIKSLAEERSAEDDQRLLMLSFAAHPSPVVQMNGNAMTVRSPMTRADFDKEFSPAGDSAAHVAGFRRSGGDVTFSNNIVTFAFGRPDDRITSLTLPFGEKPYALNAIDFARQHGGIREQFDAVAAAKAFLTPKQ